MVKNSQNSDKDAYGSVCFSKFVDFWPSSLPKDDSTMDVFLEIFRNVLEQQLLVSSTMVCKYYPAHCILEVEGDLKRDVQIIVFLYKKYWQKFFEIDFKVFSLIHVNPFHVNATFLYLQKTSVNQQFSDVFRGYRNRTLAWTGLILLAGKKSLQDGECFYVDFNPFQSSIKFI